MKVAVPAQGKDLDARMSDKPGTASHLLVVETGSGEYQYFSRPEGDGTGTGLQFVTIAIAEKCDVFLTGWLSPVTERQLAARGLKVVTGMRGSVGEAITEYKQEHPKKQAITETAPGFAIHRIDTGMLARAARRALSQIGNMLPVMAGVIFVTGLLAAFIPESALAGFFSDGALQGIFRGALVGSFFTGNPVNSYIIGGKLLDQGVGIGAVTALICAWVTVGLIQLPAEGAALGWRFAVSRNLLCFVLSVVVALVMMVVFGFLGG